MLFHPGPMIHPGLPSVGLSRPNSQPASGLFKQLGSRICPNRPRGLGLIGQIIAQDPPITAKVLQLANSAVFGLQLQVNELAEAVAYLGLEATRTLVLLAH